MKSILLLAAAMTLTGCASTVDGYYSDYPGGHYYPGPPPENGLACHNKPNVKVSTYDRGIYHYDYPVDNNGAGTH